MRVIKQEIYCKIFNVVEFYQLLNHTILEDMCAEEFIYLYVDIDIRGIIYSKKYKEEIKKDVNKIKNNNYIDDLKHLEFFYKTLMLYINETFDSNNEKRLECLERDMKNNKITEGVYLKYCKYLKDRYDDIQKFKGDCDCNISIKKYQNVIMISFLPCSGRSGGSESDEE
jgi:hypothetical protein